MKVWAVVCCDNIAGVASSLELAGELYRCGHGEDSLCCFTEEREADAQGTHPRQPPPRHGRAFEQMALPL